MKNHNTNHRKKLDPAMSRLIRATPGLQKRIAELAGCGPQYICDVVAGRKRPSEKFLAAMFAAIFEDSQARNMAAVLARYGRS